MGPPCHLPKFSSIFTQGVPRCSGARVEVGSASGQFCGVVASLGAGGGQHGKGEG